MNVSLDLPLDFLNSFLREKCAVPSLKDFQLTHSYNLIAGRDVFLVAAPGSGKTIVMAAAPLVSQRYNESAVGIIVVPSKILTEQQVSPL